MVSWIDIAITHIRTASHLVLPFSNPTKWQTKPRATENGRRKSIHLHARTYKLHCIVYDVQVHFTVYTHMLVWDIWTSARNSTYSHILSVKCSASAFTLQMPSYLTEKSFFLCVLVLFCRCCYCYCCCCCCWVSCDWYAPLTTKLYTIWCFSQMHLESMTALLNLNRIYLKQWVACCYCLFLLTNSLLRLPPLDSEFETHRG